MICQVPQPVGVGVDDRDVVVLVGQAAGHGGAYLAGAKDDDFHDALPALPAVLGSMPSARSLR